MAIKIKDQKKLNLLLELCDYNSEDGLYYSKEGNDYIDALKNLFQSKNTNDNPFTVEEVIEQPSLDEFNFKGVEEFRFICKLKATPMIVNTTDHTKINEKIIVVDNSFESEEAEEIFNKSLGVDYIITCPIGDKEHIIKIGNSRNTFKDRLGSYNCGVITNIRTASTTNLKILQSFVATRKEFNLYLLDCSDVTTFKWHGVDSVPFASPKGLAYEDILIKKFIEQFGTKPLANVQANAKVVNKK